MPEVLFDFTEVNSLQEVAPKVGEIYQQLVQRTNLQLIKLESWNAENIWFSGYAPVTERRVLITVKNNGEVYTQLSISASGQVLLGKL